MSRPRRIRSSTKLAIGFFLIAAVAYGGYELAGGLLVDRLEFTALAPGNVNLVGVNTGAGYRIEVANQMAHLVEGGSSEFEEGEKSDQGYTSTGEKRRIPLKEMLQVLQGKDEALGKLVTIMNDELKADLPINVDQVTWTEEDVKKAYAGDPVLKAKLVKQLNTNLDGTPPDSVSVGAIQTGIILKAAIEMKVPVAGQEKTLKSFILLPYRTGFARKVDNRIGTKADNLNFVRGAYLEERAAYMANTRNRQDVQKSLLDTFSKANLNRYTEAPARVVSNAFVVLQDALIEKASSRKRKQSDGKEVYDILITVNDEGRKRLWQYSRRNKGTQLLLVSNGIPIAAPRITGDMALSDVTITQLHDPRLVEDAVNEINKTVDQKDQ